MAELDETQAAYKARILGYQEGEDPLRLQALPGTTSITSSRSRRYAERDVPRVALTILALCCAAALHPSIEAGDTLPVLTSLYSRLRPVFQRHYPEVRSQQEKDSIEFAQDTRTFLIHTRLKTGEWQEAREVKGPNRRGILCSIELRQGKYNGAAVLPQTFDQRYFQTLVMAVPSPGETAYFYVHLSYPDDVDPGFLKDFQETVQQAWAGAR